MGLGRRLAIRGDLELLRRISALDSHLQSPAPDAAAEPDAVDFIFEP